MTGVHLEQVWGKLFEMVLNRETDFMQLGGHSASTSTAVTRDTGPTGNDMALFAQIGPWELEQEGIRFYDRMGEELTHARG